MSNIFYTASEEKLIFSKGPPPEKEEYKPESRLSRKTYLEFARWLKRSVQEEDLTSEIVTRRSFFNKWQVDLREERLHWLRIIKDTRDEELYRSLGLMKKGTRNVARRIDQDSLFEVPVYYQEDFYNLLLIYGMSPEDAAMFTSMVTNGDYKHYCRYAPQEKLLDAISRDLHYYAKMTKELPSRNWLREMFPHEYTRYKLEKHFVHK